MENSLSFPHSDTTNNNNNVLSLLKKPSTFFRTSQPACRQAGANGNMLFATLSVIPPVFNPAGRITLINAVWFKVCRHH
jgi:hypothetical protein